MPGDVDELTNADLDRRLAELLEPEPVYVHDAMHALVARMDGARIRSPEGAWEYLCVYGEGDEPRWVPRKFTTDIAAAWIAHRKVIVPSTELALYYATQLEIAAGALWAGNDSNVLHVLMYLTPLAICRAALKALEKEAQMKVTT